MGIKRALTVGEISRQLGSPIHRIEYLIRSRKIQPIERAGNLRVFSDKVLQILRNELEPKKEAVAHAG